MDNIAYNSLIQSGAGQPLGGKEFRFPLNGYSSTIHASRMPSAYTPGSVNVILNTVGNLDASGGTRPGLKAFKGTQPETKNRFYWIWPNGETIAWNKDNLMSVDELGDRIVMPNGTVMFNPHEYFNVTATKGEVPPNAYCVSWYRDRMIVGHKEMWYASRIGDYSDFDYGGDAEDVSRAVAGNLSLDGREGDSITCVAAIHNIALVMATQHTLWIVSGEITQSLTLVSDCIGIVEKDSWCWDGSRFWFMSYNGLYSMALGEKPVEMTGHMRDKVRGWLYATLIYDPERHGIHIIGYDENMNVTDWFYDIANNAMWYLRYPEKMRPLGGGLAMIDKHGNKGKVVFYCADGVFRYWDEDLDTDDGVAIESALALGPVCHTTGNTECAFLAELDCTLAAWTGTSARLSGFCGVNFDEVRRWLYYTTMDTSPDDWSNLGDFHYTINTMWHHVLRPRKRCNTFGMFIWSLSGKWRLQSVTAVHRGCGRIRKAY